MGAIINFNLASVDKIMKERAPIITCNLSMRYMNSISKMADEIISLNLILAQNLLKYKADERPDMVHQEAMDILSQSSTPLLIKDFEMLFDPRYKIDVVKLITEASRRRKILALWPGTMNESNLVYANEEASDYQVFNINNYDIICVY